MEGPIKVHIQSNINKKNKQECLGENNKQEPFTKLGCDLSFDKHYNAWEEWVRDNWK